jgi:DNA-binding XRE family transcriptional regulator
MSIRNNLKYRREQQGLTQQEFATLLHINVTTYVQIENGKHHPRLKTLLDIVDYFDVDARDIFFSKDKVKKRK